MCISPRASVVHTWNTKDLYNKIATLKHHNLEAELLVCVLWVQMSLNLMALHSHTCHALSNSKQIQVRSSSCCLSSDVRVRPTLRNYTVCHFEIVINYVHSLYVGKMYVNDRAAEKLWWNKYHLFCNLQHQKRNLHTCTAMCNKILKHFLKLLTVCCYNVIFNVTEIILSLMLQWSMCLLHMLLLFII
jgi:hypothetical protein